MLPAEAAPVQDPSSQSEISVLLMANTTKPNLNSVFAYAIWAIIFLSIVPNQTLAKSRRPISDTEIRDKKNQCYADVESGLWGWQCKSSMIAKENCALRCLSPACYELVYEGDPLEEGEKDVFRSQEYKYCMHKISLGESVDGIKGSFSY